MNKTAIEAHAKMDACLAIRQKAGVSYEDWCNIQFDLGCAFAEKFSPPGWSECLLQNKALGFWDWWLIIFIDDDKTLQYIEGINSQRMYRREKENLLYRKEVKEDFNHLIKRINEKL